MSATTAQLRYVVIRGVQYLRHDDVASFIRELSNAEETDVRNRLNKAAANLLRTQVKP